MRRLSELLPVRAAGVSEGALAVAEQRLGHRLPQDLRDFLRVSDGSQWADFPQCGCQLLSLSELMSMWELPQEHRSGPTRLIDVASDGSRERFCLDPASGHIVMLDITWEEGEPPTCARSLTELVSCGHGIAQMSRSAPVAPMMRWLILSIRFKDSRRRA